ncbi:SDR family NAD(P)-dependent oxidoreductase [Acinetobacter baumannii]|uniref:SDR family NAD(P)-dependent oxidoreductase n=1 Tax=Acinetobacter baumannii TaxID=470 RepID=UPI002447E0EE|nr:SDR family NAD(P)-dependent oxidoreductase [Acinetobacter baumannii]MDH2566682.1 SDR family NAD(P)-dependent oxidoreductase [Acinetobacter baumannii]
MKKICLITGGNRGIGLEIARGLSQKNYQVYIGVRSTEEEKKVIEKLASEKLAVVTLPLDVSSIESIRAAFKLLSQQENRLDVLVNNAGILADSNLPPEEISFDIFNSTLSINTFGPYFMVQEFLPLLKNSADARIINMSSDLGALSQASDPNSRYDAILAPSYRISKAALNMVTLTFAKSFRETAIKICSCSPGWCHTGLDQRVDSSKAPNTAKDGADTPIWLASEAPENQINGHFFYKRSTINW